VARQPESPKTYRGRGLFVVHVVRDGERYGDARVDQQSRVPRAALEDYRLTASRSERIVSLLIVSPDAGITRWPSRSA
jgi:hypothetical protein